MSPYYLDFGWSLILICLECTEGALVPAAQHYIVKLAVHGVHAKRRYGYQRPCKSAVVTATDWYLWESVARRASSCSFKTASVARSSTSSSAAGTASIMPDGTAVIAAAPFCCSAQSSNLSHNGVSFSLYSAGRRYLHKHKGCSKRMALHHSSGRQGRAPLGPSELPGGAPGATSSPDIQAGRVDSLPLPLPAILSCVQLPERLTARWQADPGAVLLLLANSTWKVK